MLYLLSRTNIVRKSLLSIALAGGVLSLTIVPASAAPIAGVNTVQDLINLNQGSATDGVPQGGIVVGDKRFYDFVYSRTGSPTAPSASEVEVQTAPSPVGTIGLQFEFDWTATGGTSMLSTIRYKVHVEDRSMSIDRVGVFFDGDVPTGTAGTGTFAQVTETVRTLDGTVLGVMGLFDDDAGPGVDRNANFLDLNPTQRDLDISKAIRVRSNQSGVATISIVDNTFRQVPEPATLGLLVMAGGSVLLRRRRQA